MKQIAAAFQFLTILPIPVKTGGNDLERSMAWFPLAGAAIGFCTGYGFFLFSQALPVPAASALTIAIYILITRGLHLDGYMDTIDGFFSHRKPEDVLCIMKDPRVGSFAVLGAGVWFLLLFSALPYFKPIDFIMVHTFTRFGVIIPALMFSYPRESGTGKFFVENVNWKTVLGALAVTTVIMAGIYFAALLQPVKLIVYGIGLLAAVTVALLTGLWSKRKIGGITGDVLGFTVECTHLVLALIILIAIKLTVYM